MDPETMKEWGISRVEKNVVYAMYSGLALLLDVYHPEEPNGYGSVHVSGSGWSAPLSPDARPLKEAGHVACEAYPLAKAGYTMFTINHRAAPRFRYPDPVLDCQRAVRWIRANAAEYGIDPDRIGGSSAGHLVAMLGVLDGEGNSDSDSEVERQSGKVQCVVARAGVYQFMGAGRMPLFGHHTPDEDAGSPEAGFAREASPINHVSAGDPPILLTHGTEDDIQRSEVFRDALSKAGVTVKLFPVEGSGHGPNYPGAKIEMSEIQAEYVAWFDEHLRMSSP
jgi:acetyl esterase/lipase